MKLKTLFVASVLSSLSLGVGHAQSLEELNEVAAQEARIPKPPRSVQDVLNMLERYQISKAEVDKTISQANSVPPIGASREEMRLFYQQRGYAADRLGRIEQAKQDILKTLEFSQPGDDVAIGDGYLTLSSLELSSGNPLKALEYSKDGSTKVPGAGYQLSFDSRNLRAAYQLGDVALSKQYEAQLESHFGTLSRSKGWAEWGDGWTSNYRHAKGDYFSNLGKYVEAEFEYLRSKDTAQRLFNRYKSDEYSGTTRRAHDPKVWAGALESLNRGLGRMVLLQGKPAQAEYYFREALKISIQEFGRGSTKVSFALLGLSQTVGEQGRSNEAVQLAKAALQGQVEAGVSKSSLNIINGRRQLAAALVGNGQYKTALEQYQLMSEGLAADPELNNRYKSKGDFEQLVALLETNDSAAAERLSLSMYEGLSQRLGIDQPRTAMAQAFYATALDRNGKYSEAILNYSKSIPLLVKQAQQNAEADSQSVRQQKRLSVVMEGYIDALFKSGVSNKDNLNLAFQLADIAKGSNVQKAMTQSTARYAIKDPALAGLARKEQDAQRQVQSLTELLASLSAAPTSQQLPGVQAKLKGDIERHKEQRDDFRKEIARKFPEYADLVDPKPVTVERTAKLLQPGEVLVNWYLGDWGSYVWVINNKGLAASSALPVTRAQVASDVAKLRKSLDPNVSSVDEIPPYDVATANSLYNKLLAPVKSALEGQTVVLAVPHAELGQLPIAALTTKPFAQPGKGSANFANYRNAPWLVRDVAILQLPSVTALAALRAAPRSSENSGTFIGFGDPYFSPGQAGGFKVADAGALASRGKPLKLRSVPNTRGVSSAELGLLPRLPDTEVELKDVAAVFKADPEKDIYLHERASVSNVLNADLSNKSIVMFSTHGLVPGDLDGLTQPALAMSSPLVTGEKQGDGLLKMDQVLNLKLNADWVVLSACNTAAGSGKDAEAVSGLGRAFFYAGARAMLVSNWPVDTVSSRMLMVDIFKRQQEKKIGKPEALRQAELELADKGGTSGYAYAHPLFWAPFVVIGD